MSDGYLEPAEAQARMERSVERTMNWDEGFRFGLRHAAEMADREGHAWSGAPARSFFQMAERLRSTADSARSSDDPGD